MKEALFSKKYLVRRLNNSDVEIVYSLCKENTLYYEYCPPFVTKESIIKDMKVLPKNKTPDEKYFVGYFEKDKLIAVADIVENYPETGTIFIGFFMVEKSIQGKGIGSEMISDFVAYAKLENYKKIRLAWVKGNPQAEHFWTKNGFKFFKETKGTDSYQVILADRDL